MVMVPDDLIFSRVSWASTGPAAISVMARVRANASKRFIDDLLVGEDLGQELPTAVGLGSREERLGRGLLHHLPLVHEDDPVGNPAGEAHLVGDTHHTPAPAPPRASYGQ